MLIFSSIKIMSMRKLSLIVLTALFISCNNNKALELISVYRDSVSRIDEDMARLGEDEKRKYNEIFHSSGGTGTEKKISDLQLMNDTVNNKTYMDYLVQNSIKKDDLKARKKNFMHKIDSLELELKSK